MDKWINWAGNFTYNASELLVPENVEQVQESVARSSRVKTLGTRHSFNDIADTTGTLLSLQKLNRVVALDRSNHRVTVEGGIRYGELCRFLDENGYALHNLASLPHITVAGACASASHGSGDLNGNLATVVHALKLIRANGEVSVISRDHDADVLDGAVVGLGGLGVVTQLTLNVIPRFQMKQYVYENLPLAQLQYHFNDIFSSAYSVSLFTDWKHSSFNQVWLKHKEDASDSKFPQWYGATPAAGHVHPVLGMTAENCSEQMGILGPWYERMPHFRLDFMPSAGDELQSEYFVSREHAYAALCAIDELREVISPLLHVSEVRTIAQDRLWMSPCYKQDSVGVHFTWKANGDSVRQVLPLIEQALEPYTARPHWSKLFTMQPDRVRSLYEKLPEFLQLLQQYDPDGKFRNAFLDTYIYGKQ